jgi:hypothetical protein
MVVRNFIYHAMLKYYLRVNWVIKPVACNLALWQHLISPDKQIFIAEK